MKSLVITVKLSQTFETFQRENLLMKVLEKPLKFRVYGDVMLNYLFMCKVTAGTTTSFIVLLQTELDARV